MDVAPRAPILCVSSYFKGNRFLQRCKREGAHVILLTVEAKLSEPWAREAIDEVFALPTFADRRPLINAVAYLLRSRPVRNIVALDDFDVEVAAHLREHFRLTGMNESTSRFFRDKLAMRRQAQQLGIPIPEFVGIVHHDEIRHFLATVPGPWLLKPRSEASAMGIRKCQHPDEVWQHLDRLGDDQSFFVLERMIPCDLYHVDSLIHQRQIVFDEVSRYHQPLLDVYHGGGIFASQTVRRDLPEVGTLRRLNERVLQGFGHENGASHTEFLRDRNTGAFYFLETSARVGGASITDMVEAATGLNLWEEWARIELGGQYTLPALRHEYGGAIVSLARQEYPDTSSFQEPEIFYRMQMKQHIGLVVRAPSAERVNELLNVYRERILREFHASAPPSDKATN